MLTLLLYLASLTNLHKSQWQLANNVHVTLLLTLTTPAPALIILIFMKMKTRKHCLVFYEVHPIIMHIVHIFIVNVMYSGITTYGILMKRITSRIKLFYLLIDPACRLFACGFPRECVFFPVPRLSFLTCGWKNLSPLYHISTSSSIRIRRFSFSWFVIRNLVENNESPHSILVFLCLWGDSNFSWLSQKTEFKIWCWNDNIDTPYLLE